MLPTHKMSATTAGRVTRSPSYNEILPDYI